MKYRLKIFSGLRIRYLLALFTLLIVILIAMGYFSVRAGQETTLDSLIEQGKALTTILTASAANIIETDRQISDLSIDKILSDIRLYEETYHYESDDLIKFDSIPYRIEGNSLKGAEFWEGTEKDEGTFSWKHSITKRGDQLIITYTEHESYSDSEDSYWCEENWEMFLDIYSGSIPLDALVARKGGTKGKRVSIHSIDRIIKNSSTPSAN